MPACFTGRAKCILGTCECCSVFSTCFITQNTFMSCFSIFLFSCRCSRTCGRKTQGFKNNRTKQAHGTDVESTGCGWPQGVPNRLPNHFISLPSKVRKTHVKLFAFALRRSISMRLTKIRSVSPKKWQHTSRFHGRISKSKIWSRSNLKRGGKKKKTLQHRKGKEVVHIAFKNYSPSKSLSSPLPCS